MKTPEEIKHGLEYCASEGACISDKCEYYAGGSIMCLVDLMRDALEYINELEVKVPRWISVIGGMPAPEIRVLVSAIDNDGESIAAITTYTHRLYGLGLTGWIEPWQYFLCNYKITHWMPVPEAPKEGE